MFPRCQTLLGTPLPTTFRISPTCTFSDEIRTNLRSRHEELKDIPQVDDDGEKTCPPQPIGWYPDELAWFMTISKKVLKKTPGLEKFHQYLVAETESGNITRQVLTEDFE
jgi:tRNA (cytosine34-C5)-methyltransferase